MYIYRLWEEIELEDGRIVKDYDLWPASYTRTCNEASFSSDWWKVVSTMKTPAWAANKYKAAHEELCHLGQVTRTYKNLVKDLVNRILSNGATHVGAYCDSEEYYWAVPQRKASESMRGYKSRLYAWVHLYALKHAAFTEPRCGYAEDEQMTTIVPISEVFNNIARAYVFHDNEYHEIEIPCTYVKVKETA